MEDLLGMLGRPLLMLARFVLWLAWDLCLHRIPWWIGWPICRAVAFGRFPHSGWNQYEASGFGEALIVCGVGLAMLAGACAWLYSRFPVA